MSVCWVISGADPDSALEGKRNEQEAQILSEHGCK